MGKLTEKQRLARNAYQRDWRNKPGNKEKASKKAREWYKNNKKHFIQRMKKYRKENPDVVKNSRLKERFGLTLEHHTHLIKSQKGRCAICEQKRKLCVDHNHVTGKVRGLLCNQCNFAIGCFYENEANMLKAVKYLRTHREK